MDEDELLIKIVTQLEPINLNDSVLGLQEAFHGNVDKVASL